MKKTAAAITAAFLAILFSVSLPSCALPGMTVDFANLHRINLPETAARRYGSVRETVTVPGTGYSYTVDTVFQEDRIFVFETADGAVTALSDDGAYYLKDGVYTVLLPCFQTYKDALSEYMTTVHQLDCDSRWQRSGVTEGEIEKVVYYRGIDPALESELSQYGLRDGGVLTMTYLLDEATMRFISITYAEEYNGETRVVCERTFDYGRGFSFSSPTGEETTVTVVGDTETIYSFPSGCSVGWLGTGTLYRDEARTVIYTPSADVPARLYK